MSTAPFSGFPREGFSDDSSEAVTGTRPAGSILRGKYRVGASIGRGGMGEVFEATELATGRLVAVKVVSRTFADELLMARLQREADAARRVRSEFVPELYDVDITADGELFLVMERLHGETLAERLRARRGVLSWDEVRALGDDILRGLIDAHAAGIVHRDLKPGNIFLVDDGGHGGREGGERAKILDFGVCKLDAHDGESLTSTGEAVGTISYMAPEQIRGASKVDERADVYSFATVVFEALSGRLAHDASGQIAMIASKLERPARNLREVVRVPVPVGLAALLARCLSRRPDDRIATASDLLRSWRALGAPTMEPVTGPVAERPELQFAAETGTGMSAGALTQPTSRTTRIGLIVAAAALAASSVVLIFALRPRESVTPLLPASSATFDVPIATTTSNVGAATVEASPPSVAVSALPLAGPLSMDDDDVDAGVAATKPGTTKKRGPVKRPPTPRAGPTTPQIAVEPRY